MTSGTGPTHGGPRARPVETAPISLPDQVIGLHRALRTIPHAFGGALALAYYAEPRATHDIDVNLFVPVDPLSPVARALATLGIELGPAITETLQRDGQGRVFWQETPVDLFFAYDPFHDAVAAARITVPFSDTRIPILSATHLTICKVVFNRAKDWVDIDAMRAQHAVIDVGEVLRWVGRIAGDTDPRYNRIAAVLTT